MGDRQKMERALALVLMREALSRLDAVGDSLTAVHLQMAIDTLLGSRRPTETCDTDPIH